MDRKLKTMQEMLAREIGPAAADALQRAVRARQRETLGCAERHGLEQELHRVCGAPTAEEILPQPPANWSRSPTFG
jgi:hypothetical protein